MWWSPFQLCCSGCIYVNEWDMTPSLDDASLMFRLSRLLAMAICWAGHVQQ